MGIEQQLQKLIELEKHSQGEEALTLCERLLSELDSYAELSDQDREGTRSFLKMRKAGLLRDKGCQEEALQLMAEALIHAESSRNKVQIGRCKLGLGVMHASLGNEGKGRQLLEEAVAYFQELRKEDGDYDVEQGLGWALLNLGRWMAKIDQSQAGIAQLEEAVSVLQRIGNHVGVATAYEFLGEIFEAQADHKRARESYKHAKEYYEKEGMNEKADQMARKLSAS